MVWGTRSLVTAPTTEPVTVDEVKLHARIDSNHEDALLEAYIAAARDHVEKATGRQLVEATWDVVADDFPCGDEIELLPAPLLTVASVKYLDTANVEQTWSSANYRVQAIAGSDAAPGKLSLGYGKSWPLVYGVRGAVTVRITAGYRTGGTAAEKRAAVPAELKAAIYLLVAEMHTRRTIATQGNILVPNLFSADALMGPFTVKRW